MNNYELMNRLVNISNSHKNKKSHKRAIITWFSYNSNSDLLF